MGIYSFRGVREHSAQCVLEIPALWRFTDLNLCANESPMYVASTDVARFNEVLLTRKDPAQSRQASLVGLIMTLKRINDPVPFKSDL